MPVNRPFLFFIIALCVTACKTEHKLAEPIPVYYDYQNGFSLDTLSTGVETTAFAGTIDAIGKTIVDLTSHSDVFLSEEFVTLYQNPVFYINNVLIYLADTSKPYQKRMIALLAMQRQGFAINLNFFYACNHLYKIGLIDDRMISQVLFPIDLKNRDIIKYYQADQVKAVLLDIRNSPRSSKKLKETVSRVLSGEAYRQQKEYLKEQYNIDI